MIRIYDILVEVVESLEGAQARGEGLGEAITEMKALRDARYGDGCIAPEEAAAIFDDIRLSVEYGHIVLRTDSGWKLWECKLSEMPAIGLDLRHLVTEANSRRDGDSLQEDK